MALILIIFLIVTPSFSFALTEFSIIWDIFRWLNLLTDAAVIIVLLWCIYAYFVPLKEIGYWRTMNYPDYEEEFEHTPGEDEGTIKNTALSLKDNAPGDQAPESDEDIEDLYEDCDPTKLPTNSLSNETKGRLIKYLKNGRWINEYAGTSYCRFEECDENSMGNKDLSDGTWIWPEGLHHYVEVHDISLPMDFVKHAQSINWKRIFTYIPFPERKLSSKQWIEWCKDNNPGNRLPGS